MFYILLLDMFGFHWSLCKSDVILGLGLVDVKLQNRLNAWIIFLDEKVKCSETNIQPKSSRYNYKTFVAWSIRPACKM